MKLIASVKFNNHKAYVVENIGDFKYYRLGSEIIYGTDGIRYICYKYDKPSENFKAFGGRKFTLKIEDTGEIIECNGQWWNGGYSVLTKELNLELTFFVYNALNDLKKCYVFSSSYIDKSKFEQLLSESEELFYYGYWEYEKVIKYDDLFSKYVRNQFKLDRIMKSIKKEFSKYKPFKKQKMDKTKCEHNTPCCCNCKYQIELHKHPMNKEFGKGSIKDSCGWVCLNPELTEGKSGIYFDKPHGMCEGHSFKK